jgi:hypothetical protein
MGRRLRNLLFLLALCGCSLPHPAAVGFINQTRHSDANLWLIWKAAQKSIARQIDLNPLQQALGSPAHIVAGDTRALGAMPRQLIVASRKDVSSATLFTSTGEARSDPTGLIACPLPCNVRYAAAYSFFDNPRTTYAGSWEFDGNNFNVILQYEFENQILSSLGYDMKWR